MKIYKLNEYGHGSYEENENEKDNENDENFYILRDVQINELTEKINKKISTMIQDKGTKDIKNSIKNTIKLYLNKYCNDI